MPKLGELLGADVIHAVRSDGAKLLAMKVQFSDTEQPMWEVRKVDHHGHFAKDGKITLDEGKEPAVYRKTFTSEQLQELATAGDYVDWEQGFKKEAVEENASEPERKPPLQDQDDPFSQQLNDVLDQIRKETPSEIQKVMAEQLKVGTRYYDEAVKQSTKSFQLARITTICSAILFAISICVAIFTPSSWYVPVCGTVLSTILQGVGQFGYLYNKASEQLKSFHLFLDHISRSLFAYQMGKESNNPEQVKRAIDQMLASNEILKK